MRRANGYRFWRLVPATCVLAVAVVVVTAAGPHPPDALAAPPPAIAWSPCSTNPEYECGRLAVPLDYADPASPTIDLALSRLRSRDPARRKGVLLYNFGGPGAVGTTISAPNLRDDFDHIGFDPRGVGGSAPLQCSVPPAVFAQLVTFPGSAPERQAWTEAAADLDAACGSEPVYRHMGTVAVARDMDRIREALGEETISFLGLSYGSFLGAIYADLFPTRVRAFVLDGALDPSRSGQQVTETYASEGEQVLAHFLASCAADADCPFNDGSDLVARFEQLRDRIATTPIPYDKTQVSRPFDAVDADAFADAMFYGLGGTRWSELAQALADAEGGDGTGLALQWKNYGEAPFWVIGRESGLTATDPAVYDSLAGLGPTLGRLVTREGRMSSYLPLAVDRTPAPVDAPGAPPILVVNARWDVATGYDNAVALADQLDDGRLLTYEGVGHTAYQFGTGSPCVAQVVEDYLRGVAVPSRQTGSTCPAVDPTPTSDGDDSAVPDPVVPTTNPRPPLAPAAGPLVPRFAG